MGIFGTVIGSLTPLSKGGGDFHILFGDGAMIASDVLNFTRKPVGKWGEYV